jgi:GNAT superfamily N-acetyltransferase
MGISVEAVASAKEMRRFIEYPLQLYAGDPLYVPHLLRERREFFSDANPIFQFTDAAYFLARDGAGRLHGRITAHVNRRHNEFWQDRTGFFGFFECEEDPDVAGALLEVAEKWLAHRGMELIRGPMNLSTNEECGLLVHGFELPPAFMMPYTKRYYPDLMLRFGYEKGRDLLAYRYTYTGRIPERLVRFCRRAREHTGVHVRPVRMDAFEQDVRKAFGVYNRAWAQNWGFVPMTEAQFAFMARQLKPVVEPEVALLAELDGEPVGFSLALPDYNPLLKKAGGRLFPFGWLSLLLGRRGIHSVRVLTMGVVPEQRRKGIDVMLIHDTFERGVAEGYYEGEFSWILEDNTAMTGALEKMGARLCKTYRIYEKAL